jgi:UDP-N-acetylmuramyl pentapeptide phosphotransferase/UDP-N-acetylglucosamine-1-phosphate transferase
MFDILLPAGFSFAITFFTIPVIINIAKQKKLFDVPDERKIHTSQIAPLGGIAIFAGVVLSTLIALTFSQAAEFQYFIAAALVIFFLGLKDDILVISPLKKLVGQILAASLIIHKGGIQLKSLHGFLGLQELPEGMGLLLTYFTIIIIINAFNLIDGVDGLAGSLGLMVALIFGSYFFAIGLMPYAILSFSLASALAAFLIFNFQPARIFMGDSGSLLVGMISAILAVKFINVAPGNDVMPLTSSPALGFSILLIPLLDTLRVFGIRVLNGKSPFYPDRNHIHHILLNKNLSHQSITLIIVCTSLLFVGIAYFAIPLGSTGLTMLLTGLFFASIAMLTKIRRPKRLVVTKVTKRNTLKIVSSPKIVTLTEETTLEEK